MPIAEKMLNMVEGSSLIRKMFEEGAKLKARYGAEKVYDFSLGNPDVPPPQEFKKALKDLVEDEHLSHGYMFNEGYPHVREAVSNYIQAEYGIQIPVDLILMTSGAAGALNDSLKALLNPGEEILVPCPYFVGYNQYAFVANATIATAESNQNFRLNLSNIEKAINGKTRVMLINSPNNPTGVVYSSGELKQLGDVLERASKKFGNRIYLISDEPYRKIVYDVETPSVFDAYPHTLLVTSFSKELSLAGERIGYLAISPDAEDAAIISQAAAVANQMFYVNAPSLFQLAVAKSIGAKVDIGIYRRRRDMLCEGLSKAGYKFTIPDGAFYLFPKTPIKDDVRFCQFLLDERILAVPGSGFGRAGYFRLSYAVPDSTIRDSIEGFERAIRKVKEKRGRRTEVGGHQ
jgi:aspartate aminotransferase